MLEIYWRSRREPHCALGAFATFTPTISTACCISGERSPHQRSKRCLDYRSYSPGARRIRRSVRCTAMRQALEKRMAPYGLVILSRCFPESASRADAPARLVPKLRRHAASTACRWAAIGTSGGHQLTAEDPRRFPRTARRLLVRAPNFIRPLQPTQPRQATSPLSVHAHHRVSPAGDRVSRRHRAARPPLRASRRSERRRAEDHLREQLHLNRRSRLAGCRGQCRARQGFDRLTHRGEPHRVGNEGVVKARHRHVPTLRR